MALECRCPRHRLQREPSNLGRNASNWVERGGAPEVKVASCLAAIRGVPPSDAGAQLMEEARTILHMVAADASEVQVAADRETVEEHLDVSAPAGRARRTAAFALWHVAKAGLLRDSLVPLIERYVPGPTSEYTSLGNWLADRLSAQTAQGSPPVPDVPGAGAFHGRLAGSHGWRLRRLLWRAARVAGSP